MSNHSISSGQISRWLRLLAASFSLFAIVSSMAIAPSFADAHRAPELSEYEWTQIYDGPGWAGRAGLQAVRLGPRLYVMGGRTPEPTEFNPFGSILWDDVWVSRDGGRNWDPIAQGPVANPTDSDFIWPARGYFQAVTRGGKMFVIGGQDFSVVPNPPENCPPSSIPCPPFVPSSNFFNDVWTSTDGRNWEELVADAPWTGRAGLSAIVFKGRIYILGGSNGDDIAIGGSGRVLFNDVWCSRDGETWEQVIENAPWAPRAGAALVKKGGYMYLLGGEDGFLCEFDMLGQLQCPYFNDVWRTRDGENWELVTAAAGWSPRPGHQCQVLRGEIVCFGGFGFPVGDPSVPAHPMDVWTSPDGADWTQISDSPWNAMSSYDIKYDFDSLVLRDRRRGRAAIYTFGGDREASFAAPDPMLVDEDVWSFAPPMRSDDDESSDDRRGRDR